MEKLIIAGVEAYLRAQKESGLFVILTILYQKPLTIKPLKTRQIKSKFTFDNILYNCTLDKTYNFIKKW